MVYSAFDLSSTAMYCLASVTNHKVHILTSVDSIFLCTVHKSLLDATLGSDAFTDIMQMDDIALLVEMLGVLLLDQDIMDQEP